MRNDMSRLGDFCEFRYGKSLPEAMRRPGGFLVYGSNGVVGHHDEGITDGKAIVIGRKGSVGAVHLSNATCWAIDTTYYIDKGATDVDLTWLGRALSTLRLPELNKAAAVPGLTRSDAYELKLFVPRVAEQRRIAAILDQADDLRRQRRAALKRLSGLQEMLFLGTFGDWSRPGYNGLLTRLGDQLDFLTSGSRGWAAFYKESGSLFLRIQNVKSDELDLSDVAYVQAPHTTESERTRVRQGDVLLSITADLGRTAVISADLGEAFINQHLSILRSSRLEPRFLSAAIASPAGQKMIQSKNREGVKAGLNFDDVRSLLLPDVPLHQQRAFATRVAEIDTLKAVQKSHLQKLDTLFAALQHRAFRGEL